MWTVVILEGYGTDLARELDRLSRDGDVRFVLPNGVNRWTIIVASPKADPHGD